MLHFKQHMVSFVICMLTSMALAHWVLAELPAHWTWIVYGWTLYRLARAFVSTSERWAWTHTPTYTIDFSHTRPSGLTLGYGFGWDRAQVTQLSRYETTVGHLPPTGQDRGGVGALQAVGSPYRITLPQSALTSHMALEGATRSGKTVLLANLAAQLIRQGEGAVTVIDPKGSTLLLETLQQEAAAVGREFRRFAPFLPEQSCKYNPLSSCAKATEIEARLKPLFPESRGNSFWSTQPLSVAHRVAQMHQALGQFPFELPAIYRDSTDKNRLRHLLCRYLAPWHGDPFAMSTDDKTVTLAKVKSGFEEHHVVDDLALHVLKDIQASDERFDEINGNFGVALSGIVDSDITHLIQGDDMLSWAEIDEKKMIVLVQTHSLSTRSTGYKMGQLFMQDFQGHMGARYAHPERSRDPITLIVDEIAEMVYPDFRQSISKIGEGGGRMILGWQSEADLDSAIGYQEAKVVRANIRTRLYLRIDDDATASEISRYSGTCKVRMQQSQGSSHSYASGSPGASQARVQVADVEVPLLSPNWLQQLPQGEAFARIDGLLYKLSVPLREEAK